MRIQIRAYEKSELFLASVAYAYWNGYRLEQWDAKSGYWWIVFEDKSINDLFFFALGNYIIVSEDSAHLLDQVFKLYSKTQPSPEKIIRLEVGGSFKDGTEKIRAEICLRQLEPQFWQRCPIEKSKTCGTIAEWREDIEDQMREAFAQAQDQSVTW